jgi:peptidoglycan/LPS O-acetylase OafA/YrhL
LILALAVIISHATPVLLGLGANEPLSCFLRGTTLGDVAVGGFFAVSGFLVTASWRKSTPFRYLQKRAARILPGFIIACAITVVLAIATSTNARGSLGCTSWLATLATTATLRRPVVCFSYSANPYPSETNASLWTIKYEVGCYIATALLGFAGLLLAKRRFVVVLLFIVLCTAGLLLDGNSAAKTPLSYAIRLGAFYAAGMTVYCFRDSLPRTWQLTTLCFALVLLSSFSRHLVMVVLPTAGVYLLFRFVYADRVFVPGLKEKIGDLSYGLYLYGWPVAQSLAATVGPKVLGVWSMAAASILCCLPIAYLSWHCIEKPSLSLVPRT